MKKQNKYKNKITRAYRSKLEEFCAAALEKAGIEFEYEAHKIELSPKFKLDTISYEKSGQSFGPSSQNIRAITYTPDFVGDNWIIEVKGMQTPEFNIKWKLFKKYLLDSGLYQKYTLYKPTNQKQVLQTVEIIKKNG